MTTPTPSGLPQPQTVAPLPVAPKAEPEWIDDPHDIEQGMMRNPKWKPTPQADSAQSEKRDDPIVGHKTFWNEDGTHRHEPLRESEAIRDVIAERRRQVESEGWTPEHDDEHSDGQMAKAASCYVWSACYPGRTIRPPHWPWDAAWWKPRGPRRDLVRAVALLIAEIERIDRAALTQGKQAEGAEPVAPNVETVAVQEAPEEIVGWEYRHLDTANTPNRWSEWERCKARNPHTSTDKDYADEIQAYIDMGYKYELRTLYTRPPLPVAPKAEPAAGWTDDQMIRFGNYITSKGLHKLSYEQRLGVFRKHEALRGIATPQADSAQPVGADTLTDDSDRLKSCANCGGDGNVEQAEDGGYFIQCTNAMCGMSTCLMYACGEDPVPILMEKWNKRALASPPRAIPAEQAAPTEPECVTCQRCGFENWIQDGEAPGQTTARMRKLAAMGTPAPASSTLDAQGQEAQPVAAEGVTIRQLRKALDIAERYVALQNAPWAHDVQKDDLKEVRGALSGSAESKGDGNV